MKYVLGYGFNFALPSNNSSISDTLANMGKYETQSGAQIPEFKGFVISKILHNLSKIQLPKRIQILL